MIFSYIVAILNTSAYALLTGVDVVENHRSREHALENEMLARTQREIERKRQAEVRAASAAEAALRRAAHVMEPERVQCEPV